MVGYKLTRNSTISLC